MSKSKIKIVRNICHSSAVVLIRMLVHKEGGRKEAIGGGNELAKKIGLLGKTRRDRIRNEVMRKELCQMETLVENMKRRLSCFGHVARMENRRYKMSLNSVSTVITFESSFLYSAS